MKFERCIRGWVPSIETRISGGNSSPCTQKWGTDLADFDSCLTAGAPKLLTPEIDYLGPVFYGWNKKVVEKVSNTKVLKGIGKS